MSDVDGIKICILEAVANKIKNEIEGGVTVCKTENYLLIGKFEGNVYQ